LKPSAPLGRPTPTARKALPFFFLLALVATPLSLIDPISPAPAAVAQLPPPPAGPRPPPAFSLMVSDVREDSDLDVFVTLTWRWRVSPDDPDNGAGTVGYRAYFNYTDGTSGGPVTLTSPSPVADRSGWLGHSGQWVVARGTSPLANVWIVAFNNTGEGARSCVAFAALNFEGDKTWCPANLIRPPTGVSVYVITPFIQDHDAVLIVPDVPFPFSLVPGTHLLAGEYEYEATGHGGNFSVRWRRSDTDTQRDYRYVLSVSTRHMEQYVLDTSDYVRDHDLRRSYVYAALPTYEDFAGAAWSMFGFDDKLNVYSQESCSAFVVVGQRHSRGVCGNESIQDAVVIVGEAALPMVDLERGADALGVDVEWFALFMGMALVFAGGIAGWRTFGELGAVIFGVVAVAASTVMGLIPTWITIFLFVAAVGAIIYLRGEGRAGEGGPQ
jgi:hypothetical protein